MKRRYLKTIIFGLLFVGMVSWVLLKERGRVTESGEAFGLQPTAISRVSLQAGEYSYVLEKRGDDWWITSPFVGMADPDKVKPMLDAIAALKVVERKNVSLQDPEFGLQSPVLTLEFTYGGSRKVTLKLGAQSQMGEKYFASLSDRSSLVLVDSVFRSQVDESPENLRWKRIAKVVPEKAKWLVIRGTQGAVTVTRTPLAGEPTWAISAPRKLPADQPAVNAVLRELNDMEAVDYLDYTQANLAATGLSQPTLSVTYQPDTGPSVTVFFGKQEEREVKDETALGDANKTKKTQVVYVTSSLRREILAMPAAFFLGTNKSLLDLRDKHLVSVPSDKIVGLKVERAKGLSFEAVKSEGVWNLRAPRTGRASSVRLSDVLSALTGLEAARYEVENRSVDLAKYGLKAPQAVLTITAQGSTSPLVLSLGSEVPGEAGRMYARLSSTSDVYVVDDSLLRNLPDSVDQLMDAGGGSLTSPPPGSTP